MKFGAAVFILALIAHPAPANADQADFCNGWKAGWNAAYENRGKYPAYPPYCPYAPYGRDTFSGGFEAGMLAALSKMAGG